MDVTKKQVRIALVGLALAFAAGVAVAYLASGGHLSYTEPRGNPSLSPPRNAKESESGTETAEADGFAVVAPANRRAAPGFAFADDQGKPLTLADFKGRVILVNLWATWCPPCIAEMPDLDQLQRRLGGTRFQVVTISLDRGGVATVKRWFARNEIRALPAYTADAGQFPNAVIPASLLLDAQGRVAWHGTGMRDWAGPAADTAIRAMLAE